MAFNLNLTFGPRWENVSNIRNFVTEILSTGIVDLDDAKKVATASSELVENVVKYSAVGGAVIDIKKDPAVGKISLTIRNIASLKNIQTFESIYKTVIDGDPKEIYKQMMLRSFNDPQHSQLGLARIRYECQGDIFYEVGNNTDIISNSPDIVDNSDDNKLLSVTVEIPVKITDK
ncbi:MAG: hypothetical protein WC836_03505 [Desulfobacula sp.]|jgi:hypothetical protein